MAPGAPQATQRFETEVAVEVEVEVDVDAYEQKLPAWVRALPAQQGPVAEPHIVHSPAVTL